MGYQRLNDREWELIWACFPDQVIGRPRRWSDRACLDAVLYVLFVGCRWEDLPKDFPPKSTVYDRFVLWVRTSVLKKVFKRLRRRLPVSNIFYLDATTKAAKKGKGCGTGGQSKRQQNQPRRGRSRAAS